MSFYILPMFYQKPFLSVVLSTLYFDNNLAQNQKLMYVGQGFAISSASKPTVALDKLI